jgi:hypothetical protein
VAENDGIRRSVGKVPERFCAVEKRDTPILAEQARAAEVLPSAE